MGIQDYQGQRATGTIECSEGKFLKSSSRLDSQSKNVFLECKYLGGVHLNPIIPMALESTCPENYEKLFLNISSLQLVINQHRIVVLLIYLLYTFVISHLLYIHFCGWGDMFSCYITEWSFKLIFRLVFFSSYDY